MLHDHEAQIVHSFKFCRSISKYMLCLFYKEMFRSRNFENGCKTTFFNESSFEVSLFYQSSPGFVETSPAFFEGKSECRVRVFLESGFCTGPSPVRVSQYAFSSSDVNTSRFI